MKKGYIYILTNEEHTVLYTGVTSDLPQRIAQHRSDHYGGFTSRYNLTELVYYEAWPHIEAAIEREKQIKSWRRSRKIDLITAFNPTWRDLLPKEED